MDLIERAAHQLARHGLGASARNERKHPRLRTPGALRHQVPPAPEQQSAFEDQGGRDLDRNSGIRSNRVANIDSNHLKAFEDVRLSHGQRSQAAESFRHIKRRVINYNAAKAPEPSNVLLVTSAKPDEGKTHVAVNLAMSVALERDLSVLLVDADLTRPDVTKRLGIEADRGLYDYLDDPRIGIPEILLSSSVDQLSIIPAGRKHERSTELLASSQMKQFVEDISAHQPARVVIFDGPPLLATSEAAVLSRYVSQVLFVVEWGVTTHAEIEHALELVDSRPATGFVLNKSRPQFGAIGSGSYEDYF